ncbi:MAG: saccharopine dehydrogenase NADP-binding domain-containing protein [Myxococcales bacterium]|nr:saccharopine dehydrogenase NADP-binding domain-containing protein [Myxococcales bacterium]
MKRVLVLGAGHSTPSLIQHLLTASAGEFHVSVCDKDLAAAQQRVQGHPSGEALALNAANTPELMKQIQRADVVVNFLAPSFQVPVAELCLEAKRSMVSASYRDPKLRLMDAKARSHGLTLASELGLDPGLDHMSAMQLMEKIHADGGTIRSFWSYGGGLAEQHDANPLGYVVTWNPRNVVMAGESGARFLLNSQVRIVPHWEIFGRTWPVHLPTTALAFEAYPNRDALGYIDIFGLESISTMVRATLRYPGFCRTWMTIVRLGLADETTQIENLSQWRWIDLIEAFLPPGRGTIEERVRTQLGTISSDEALEKLHWLGLFASTPIGDLCGASAYATTPAAALTALLQHRLALPKKGKDRVILHHDMEATTSTGIYRWRSTLDILGDSSSTAMAKSVGLPAALATVDLLNKQFPALGCPLPVEAAIYQRYLPKLETLGMVFTDTHEKIPK